MRLFQILTALVVAAVLYLLVFERAAILSFARGGGDASDLGAAVSAGIRDEPETATTPEADEGDVAPGETAVPVVALKSTARQVENAVLVRGRTEAARQVDLRAETSGTIVSEPLRKGAFVDAGTAICNLYPGTRQIALSEAQARLQEAQSRLPEARARVAEAEARLTEATINDNAAKRLSEGGFASDTRVAATGAAAESARAGVEAASSGIDAAQAGIRSAEAGIAAAKDEIARLTITAPFAGLLESDSAELGTLLQPGGLCATVIRLDPIKLVGFVPETDVDKVTVGAPAGARLATGREVIGQVSFLSRSADPTTRTFRVEVLVPNEDLLIRDGQTVEIAIASDGASAHLLPQSALTLDNDGNLGVRLVADGDRVAFAALTVLRDTPDGIWVEGLPEQASVIVVGQEFVIADVLVAPTYRETGQ